MRRPSPPRGLSTTASTTRVPHSRPRSRSISVWRGSPVTTRPTPGKSGAGLDRPPAAWPLLIVALASCAPLSTIGTYDRPPSLCSRNPHGYRVQAVLVDDLHHLKWLGNVDSGGYVCTQWDLIGDRGRFGFVDIHSDTTWMPWFQAWWLRGPRGVRSRPSAALSLARTARGLQTPPGQLRLAAVGADRDRSNEIRDRAADLRASLTRGAHGRVRRAGAPEVCGAALPAGAAGRNHVDAGRRVARCRSGLAVGQPAAHARQPFRCDRRLGDPLRAGRLLERAGESLHAARPSPDIALQRANRAKHERLAARARHAVPPHPRPGPSGRAGLTPQA